MKKKKDKVPESESEDIVESDVFSSFEEYPNKIKETALRIIDEDKVFDYIINTVSIIHKGNDKLKESLVLVCGSVYIDELYRQKFQLKQEQGKPI